MGESTHPALARAGRAAVTVVKVGVAAIPVVGGSAVEVIGALEGVREARIRRFQEELVRDLGERVGSLEERVTDSNLARLVEEAVESAAAAREDINVDLIARVVATALAGEQPAERIDQHRLLLRVAAELSSAHFRILLEVGTLRTASGVTVASPPAAGARVSEATLRKRFPELSDVLPPLLGDLLASGLIEWHAEDLAEERTAAALLGRPRPPRGMPTIQLTPYGFWVLEQLSSIVQRPRSPVASE